MTGSYPLAHGEVELEAGNAILSAYKTLLGLFSGPTNDSSEPILRKQETSLNEVREKFVAEKPLSSYVAIHPDKS